MIKSKFMAAVIAGLMSVSAIPAGAFLSGAAESQIIAGDIDRNGVFGKNDLVKMHDHLLRRKAAEDVPNETGDLNGDLAIDSLDMIALRKNVMCTVGLEEYKGLVINEVCSSNQNSYTDASGAEPDWIELYNGSDKDLVLDGVGVSDGAKKKFKFAFPEGTVIPAGGYIIICADDAVNQAEGEYHAAFKLSATGETVYLTHPLYGEIDSVAVPELDTDISYGRYKNGSENFTYITTTPGESNDLATDLALVEKPLFSQEGGFYDSGFMLSLSDANGNEIYYTTDGSDPSTSDTAKLYTGEINIYNNTGDANVLSAVTDITLYNYVYGVANPIGSVDKGRIIKAVSKTPDGRFSEVVTNGYYISKTASYYKDMKVVSMSTDYDYLFDEDTGAYMIGSGFYEWLNSPEFVDYDAGDVNNPTNYNKDGRASEFPVNIQIYENGEIVYTADMGARISGNWTRAMRQKSFRLYARSEYGDSKIKYNVFGDLTDINGEIIDRFDKVTIWNGGNDNEVLHFRDAFIQDIASDLSVDTMAAEPCVLFIDGEFWGFYMLREKADGDYIESHYGLNKDDVTVLKNGAVEDGLDSSLAEFRELMEWAYEADMSVDANYQRFADAVDIQSFMDYVTVETYLNNSDWMEKKYTNNWQAWRSEIVDTTVPEADGKWRFIFYDLDQTAGIWGNEVNMYYYDSLNVKSGYALMAYNFAAVLKNLMNNSEFAQMFYDNYIDIIDTTFDPSTVDTKITEYSNAYREVTKASFLRFGGQWSADDYDNRINLFREFFRNRPSYAKDYLEKFCKPFGVNQGTQKKENLIPDVYNWTYYGSGNFSYDMSDKSFTCKTTSAGSLPWDVQSQAKGIYLEQGKTYLLTFEAKCSVPAEMTTGLMHKYNSEYIGCWYGAPMLTNEFQKFTYVFTMDDVTGNDWFLYFNYAGTAGEYTVRNVTLTEQVNLINNQANWRSYSSSGASSFTSDSATAFTFDVTSLPDNTYDMQAYYGGLSLEAGKTYTYSFTIESTVAASLKAKIQQNFPDYLNYSNVFPEFGTEPEIVTVTFTADESCSDVRIGFNCGYAETLLKVSEIIVVCHD